MRSLIGVVPSRHLVTGAIGNCTIWAGKEFENVMGYIIRSNIFLLNKYFFQELNYGSIALYVCSQNRYF